MDLGEFLLARISEDEAAATAGRERHLTFWVAQEMGRSGGSLGRDYVGRFNPDRVLAECEAKRRIVEAYNQAESLRRTPLGSEDRELRGYLEATVDALKSLATPYADHPDFQQDWKD